MKFRSALATWLSELDGSRLARVPADRAAAAVPQPRRNAGRYGLRATAIRLRATAIRTANTSADAGIHATVRRASMPPHEIYLVPHLISRRRI